jgi:putative metallopeptidase DUF4344
MRPIFLGLLLALGSLAGQAAPAAKGKTNMIRTAYDAPKDPKHKDYYERLKKEKLLERYAQVLGVIRLPKPLLIKFAGCDGTVNAWYEPADGTVTFCYEYVDDLWKISRGAKEVGIDPDQAWGGTLVFILLHETSHALFDILKVPVLGREEDAADQVAAFTLLRAGEGAARRALGPAAWMYLHDSKGRMPDQSDFADVHGLDVQRFYNVLCMAYGSDPQAFKGMVDKGYLPKDRAEGCSDEYKQVGFAVKTLINPSIDVEMARSVRTAHKARWEHVDKPADKPAEESKAQAK